MSRIGRARINIPAGVTVKLEGSLIIIKGAKGEMRQELDPQIKMKMEEGKIILSRTGEDSKVRALHGLYGALIANLIAGVSAGFEKNLELTGVGYRAALQGKNLVLSLGYSHPIEVVPPEGIEFKVEGQNKIKIMGFDRARVGQVAANVRNQRPIEPYKGKGIKYRGEVVKRKAGKAVKAAAGGAAA